MNVVQKTIVVLCFLYSSVIWDIMLSLNYFENINPVYFIQHEANRGFVNLLVNNEIPWLEVSTYLIAPIAVYWSIHACATTYKNFDGNETMQKKVKKTEYMMYFIFYLVVCLRFFAPLTWYVSFQNILSFAITRILQPIIYLLVGYMAMAWVYIAYKLHIKETKVKKCLKQ